MAFSTEQRAEQVAQANAEKNRNKEEAKEILSTEAGVLQMASLAEEGGSMGRRIARELRRFEATGRVSNWLAGETIKAESKREVPSSVVDDFVRRGVVPAAFQVQPALPFGGLPQYVPTIPTEGGGGETCIGFGLYENNGGVWVNSGTVNGEVPNGFGDDGKSIASGGSGDAWVEVVINEETGEIVSTAVTGGGETPEDDETTFYYTLGRYEFVDGSPEVTNYGCGSVEVTICRNWFAAEAPFYGVTITRCGCGGGGGY